MSHQPHQQEVMCTVDPYQYLQIKQNSDGSITRLASYPTTAASLDIDTTSQVLSKDLPLNSNKSTFLRLYLPRKPSSSSKLPLIVYFHGGGFILVSASSTMTHDFCSPMANHLFAVIASLEYRLAPEARLPAAYDDAVEALHWLKTTDEEWIHEFSDISKCYLMGTSAGGNMAYHVGLHVASAVDEFGPLKIQGLILHHPFFGGSQRTESEVRLVNSLTLPLSANDLMWELSLPIGADRDHVYCNPTMDSDWMARFDEIGRLGWVVIFTACDKDPMIDRQMELVKMLRSRGVKVVDHVGEGDHGMDFVEVSKAGPLFNLIKDFISPS